MYDLPAVGFQSASGERLSNETVGLKKKKKGRWNHKLTAIHGYSHSKYFEFLQVRAAIHVGNASFQTGQDVEKILQDDMMQSVAPWLEQLLEHYRVLIYNGQLDIIVAYPLTVSYLQVRNDACMLISNTYSQSI